MLVKKLFIVRNQTMTNLFIITQVSQNYHRGIKVLTEFFNLPICANENKGKRV